MLVDSGADVFFKKIQIQIRLRAKDYERVFDTMLAGQAIVDRVNEDSFAGALVASLNKTSTMQDSLDYSKYGWLLPNFDLVVESATGFPVSSKKVNPEESGSYDSSASSNTSHQQLELLLIGVALAGVVIASVLGCLYCRLRSEYDSLQKDKGISLREMWNRFFNKNNYMHLLTFMAFPFFFIGTRLESDLRGHVAKIIKKSEHKK